MTKRLTLLSLLLLPMLLACKPEAPPTMDDANAAPTAEAPASEAPAQAADPAANDATVDAGAPADPGADAIADSGTEAPAVPVQAAPLEGPAPVAGEDYVVLPNGQPFEPLNGKIEVVEVFNYVCPACAAFQPLVNNWKKTLPADVRFTYVPAPFGPRWDPYVRSYYAADTMGVAVKSHDGIFNAIHIDKTLKGELGEDSPEAIAAVYAQYGVDPKQFTSTMASFAVAGRINRAKQFIVRTQTNSTPTVVINGKYKVKGKSFPDMLRIADHLIAQERAAGG